MRSTGTATVLRMNAKAARRRPWRQRAARPAPGGLASCLLAVLARHLAFHALDVEVDAREELVLGHGVGGQQFLAVLACDRALPDVEGAVLQALLDLFDRSEERRVGKECRSRWSPYH